MSEFGGLWKHEKIQHALYISLVLGSTTLLQLDFLRKSDPNLPWEKFQLGKQNVQHTKILLLRTLLLLLLLPRMLLVPVLPRKLSMHLPEQAVRKSEDNFTCTSKKSHEHLRLVSESVRHHPHHGTRNYQTCVTTTRPT